MNIDSGLIASIAAAVMAIGVFVYIGFSFCKKEEIHSWGKHVFALAVIGLLIFILLTSGSGLNQSVQASLDDPLQSGPSILVILQSVLCGVGGSLIAFSVLSTIFVKKQIYRRKMFLLLSFTILSMTVAIEMLSVFF